MSAILRAVRVPAAVEQALVVRRVVLLVEAGREAKVRQLDVPVLVDQDVVRLDVAVRRMDPLDQYAARLKRAEVEARRRRTDE